VIGTKNVRRTCRNGFDELCTFPPISTKSNSDVLTRLASAACPVHCVPCGDPLHQVICRGIKTGRMSASVRIVTVYAVRIVVDTATIGIVYRPRFYS
jgi:hypothetical protein